MIKHFIKVLFVSIILIVVIITITFFTYIAFFDKDIIIGNFQFYETNMANHASK